MWQQDNNHLAPPPPIAPPCRWFPVRSNAKLVLGAGAVQAADFEPDDMVLERLGKKTVVMGSSW